MKYLVFVFCLFGGMISADDIPQYLQSVSVTVSAGNSTGSGVVITRDVEGKKVNFILTAAHVVDGLRSTREIINTEGQKKLLVEFKDPEIIQELIEEGRTVGQMTYFAQVLKYSDSENGEDIALLMVRKKGLVDASARFYLSDGVVPVGTKLYHVGSRLGLTGAGSFTFGVMSQVGRVIPLGNRGGVVFDLVNVAGLPGSSGGGVFMAEGEHAGEYIGMLTRGGDSSFNLISPIRRMKEYAKEQKLEWLLDNNVPTPSLKDILNMPMENSEVVSPARDNASVEKPTLFKEVFNKAIELLPQ